MYVVDMAKVHILYIYCIYVSGYIGWTAISVCMQRCIHTNIGSWNPSTWPWYRNKIILLEREFVDINACTYILYVCVCMYVHILLPLYPWHGPCAKLSCEVSVCIKVFLILFQYTQDFQYNIFYFSLSYRCLHFNLSQAGRTPSRMNFRSSVAFCWCLRPKTVECSRHFDLRAVDSVWKGTGAMMLYGWTIVYVCTVSLRTCNAWAAASRSDTAVRNCCMVA